MYLTVALDDDLRRANDKFDHFLEACYGQPAAVLRRRQMGYAGPASGMVEWLNDYVCAGCSTAFCASPASTSAIWRPSPG